MNAPSNAITPAGLVIDGSRATRVAKARREVHGLDFPLANGAVIRLPYPGWRYFPIADDPGKPSLPGATNVGKRFGYPPTIAGLADQFHALAEGPDPDPEALFARAVLVAWTMLNRGQFEEQTGRDARPEDLFEMDATDATVFCHRMYRLTKGLVDLERDETGAYLLPAREESSEEQPADPDPESESQVVS